MVVQKAAAWPAVSDRVRELFRAGAEAVLRSPDAWLEELHAAVLSGERARALAADPVLAAGARRSNLANLRHWAASNVRAPGEPVAPAVGPEILDVARDLVRRGLDENGLDSYRAAQNAAWRRWMQICFALTDDPAELQPLLDLSALSIATFLDDTVAAIAARIEAEREELTRGTHAERRATVALLLEGAPISARRAEQSLGHGLTGPHTAAVVWGPPDADPAALEAVAEVVRAAVGAGRRLTVVANAAALWLWMPSETPVDSGALRSGLRAHPDLRVALGRPGSGLDGFRRSHLDAVATQQVLARMASAQQLARYDEVQLAALLTVDPVACEDFLRDTLGGLLTAEEETRRTVLVWVQEQCSTSRTATRLFTHRNTVVRRLARADALLPRPLAENLLPVAAALEVLRWRAAPSRPEAAGAGDRHPTASRPAGHRRRKS